MDDTSRMGICVDRERERRWRALLVIQLGVAMIVIDATIVDVALGAIKKSLAFSDATLLWVVNAYLLTFAGFQLLAGRLGDLFGHRRLFLLGIAVFTVASLLCGLAQSQRALIASRALQGFGGAIVLAVALSLTVNLFPEESQRSKALAVSSVITSAGGSIGLLLGGVLTSVLDWHWIFLVNLPVGVTVYAAAVYWLPVDEHRNREGDLDALGALAVTAALLLATYAIVGGNRVGWTSITTLALFSGAVMLLALFIRVETRVPSPLVPLKLFTNYDIGIGSTCLALLCTAAWAWYFFTTLYLQLILGWDALQVGIAFLPATLTTVAFSLGLSARLVARFGTKPLLVAGHLLTTVGLVLLSHLTVHSHLTTDILPGMLLLGLGTPMAFSALVLASMAKVMPQESGSASGVVNTASTMGGTIGLAILGSIAEARTSEVLATGATVAVALNTGYNLALHVSAVISTITALCVLRLRS